MNNVEQSNFELISEIIQAVRYMSISDDSVLGGKGISTDSFKTKVVNYLKDTARLIMERNLSKL